jgi:hypothetical protein
MQKSRFAAALAVALVPLACSEQTVLEPNDSPRFQVHGDGSATATDEQVDVCKVATSGTYTFRVTGPGNALLTSVASPLWQSPRAGATAAETTMDVEVAAGSCRTVAFKGGALYSVTITEIVPNGWQLDKIETDQLLTGNVTNNTVFGTATVTLNAGGSPMAGGVARFYNSLIPIVTGQGCTPGYWRQSQHFGNWSSPYTPGGAFSGPFANAFPGRTLLQVVSNGGGGLNALGRHAVAALLNAQSNGVDYGMTAQEVIDAFNAAYMSGSYNAQKDAFEALNEQGCSLGRAL